jgi:hypothetical protein
VVAFFDFEGVVALMAPSDDMDMVVKVGGGGETLSAELTKG